MPDQQQGPCTQEAELHRYCERCHRKLKDPISMKAGYGPVCMKKRGTPMGEKS